MSHGHVPGVRLIVLVGFMAAGKTIVGHLLAERLGWDFVDLDQEIEDRYGYTPAEVIREQGETVLRELESRYTAELAEAANLVLAPGGGWVTRPELAERLGPGTVRVWLRVSPETAARRAAAEAGEVDRPLLEGPDPVERARSLLAAREPLYRAAELTVDAERGRPEEVVEEILRLVNAGKSRSQKSDL